MKNVKFLFLMCVIVLSAKAFSQNSPFSVNSTSGQSVSKITSGVSYGAFLALQRFSSTTNFYALETGAGSTDDLRLHVNGSWSTPIMSFKTDGNVGVGTASPLQKFHVEGNFYLNSGSFLINQTASTNAKLYFSKIGSYTWDLGTEVSDPNNNFILFNRANSTYPITVSTSNVPTFKTDKIRLEGMSNVGGNTWDIKCRDIIDNDFGIYNVSQSAYRLYINNLGNVGVGTTDPKGYKLAIAGKAVAEEVTVKLQASWPDYVFNSDYNLLSLEEIKAYIDKNKHLPEVPSAKEMEANGVQLGEMNMLLLKKIEELTLHLIEQNIKIEDQDKRMLKLETENVEMKPLIKK
jgi:predicted RNA-binding protein with TRAM domain